jgi:ABC-type transporter Mla maintaining outer membrane lipid asymmetry ATPase subunit MlaF
VITLLLLAAFSEATLGRAVALGAQGFGLALLVALVFIYDEPFKGQSSVSSEPIVTVIAEMQNRTE